MYLRNAAAIGILTILATARAAEVSKGPFEPESPADAAAIASANSMQCDLTGYKEAPGLKAETSAGSLRVTWQGAREQELRVSFGLLNAAPVIREMEVRRQGGQWTVLGRDLTDDSFAIHPSEPTEPTGCPVARTAPAVRP